MSRQVRLVLVTFGIVVILFSVMIVLDSTKTEQQIQKVIFRNSPPTDVRSVYIHNNYGDIFVDFLDGGYVLGKVPIEVVDMKRFVDMMTDAAAVYAMTEIKSPQNKDVYGLNNKADMVEVTYSDGKKMNLTIGNYEPISKGYYCSVSGFEGVYLIEEERLNGFKQAEEYFISKYVTPLIPVQSQSSLGHILGISFEGGTLQEKVTLLPVVPENKKIMLDVISFGSATHLIKIDGMNYQVDQRYATLIFDSVLGLKSTDIIDYNLSQEDMASFGFDNPDMHVVFDYRDSPEKDLIKYDVEILEKSGIFYASCNNRGIIYQIVPPYFYEVKLEKFPVRWFFSPLLYDLEALEIQTKNENYLFELSGTTNSDMAVTCNEENFDLDRFRRLYKLVTSAAHDNNMRQQVEITGDPLIKITYHYRNVNKPDDTLGLYDAEFRRHYAKVNGKTGFTIKENFYSRVSQALDVLFTEKVFEIEW